MDVHRPSATSPGTIKRFRDNGKYHNGEKIPAFGTSRAVTPRACRVSHTFRLFDSIADVSEMLDHPLEPIIRLAEGENRWRTMGGRRVLTRLRCPPIAANAAANTVGTGESDTAGVNGVGHRIVLMLLFGMLASFAAGTTAFSQAGSTGSAIDRSFSTDNGMRAPPASRCLPCVVSFSAGCNRWKFRELYRTQETRKVTGD
jgi:hypothetical protein